MSSSSPEDEPEHEAEQEDEGDGEDDRPRGGLTERPAGPAGLVHAETARPPPSTASPRYRATLWPGATRRSGRWKRTTRPSNVAGRGIPWALHCASTSPVAGPSTQQMSSSATSSV